MDKVRLEFQKGAIKAKANWEKMKLMDDDWFLADGWGGLIGLELGVILMIVGFLLWYVKVQLPLDREMMRSEKRLVGEEGKGEEDRRGGVLNDSH